MPYIVGVVSQQDGPSFAPCMNFQVKCLNKPYINPVITHVPPYFWVTVGVDEYVLKVTNSAGLSKTAVASALSDVGGVVLDLSLT